MYFTNGSSRAFEMLMRGKPGFDRYENGGCADCEDCNTCHFYRPHWEYQFCVYGEIFHIWNRYWSSWAALTQGRETIAYPMFAYRPKKNAPSAFTGSGGEFI